MKLKACVKYNLWDRLIAVAIFYTIFYGVLVFTYVTASIDKSIEQQSVFQNIELASLIFIFIMALNSFKSHFLFQMANGSSRKTIFTSFFASLIPISLLFSLTNSLNAFILPRIVTFQPMYGSLYCSTISSSGNTMTKAITMTIGDHILSFIWLFLLHIVVAAFGYFITLLYYRMNSLLKYVVSFGVPLILFFILPLITGFLQLDISEKIFEFMLKTLGITSTSANPAISFITFPVITAIIAFFSFLLIRKAPLKQE